MFRSNPYVRRVLWPVVFCAAVLLTATAVVHLSSLPSQSPAVPRPAISAPAGDEAQILEQQRIDQVRAERSAHAYVPPPLSDILESAVVLANAGLIQPPPPSLREVLESVVLLEAVRQVAAARDAQVLALIATPTASVPVRVERASTPPPPPSPPPAPKPVLTPPPAASANVRIDSAFADAVLTAVNADRASKGLDALYIDGGLQSVADSYAQQLAAAHWFSHTGPDGGTVGDRLAAAGAGGVPGGEVLAMGWDGWPAAEVAQAWHDSPPHREQILNAGYTRAGIACAFSNEDGQAVVRCVMELAA